MSFPDRAPLQLRASIALVLALAAFALLAWPASAQQPDLPSEPPARPTGLTLDVGHDLVALTWNDPGDASITHYEVFRRDRDVHASGEFISITANTGSAETSYTDDTAQPMRRYRYRIKAVNQHGASQWSRFAGAETPPAPTEDTQLDPSPVTTTKSLTDSDEDRCPDRVTEPTPVAIAVDAVPIVVPSTTADYFVLYVNFDLDGRATELPVLVKKGEAGATTLAENVKALPKERYRVEKYLIADPADVDGDCLDDMTELSDPVGMSPVNSFPPVGHSDGAVSIPDLDTYLPNSQFNHAVADSKFFLTNAYHERPGLVFMNVNVHSTHAGFLRDTGIDQTISYRGYISYDARLDASDGSLGAWYVWLIEHVSVSEMERVYAFFAANMPVLRDNIYLLIPDHKLDRYERDREEYERTRMYIALHDDLRPDRGVDFLNAAVGYGRLRVMAPDERPHPREVVIYEAAPNELPRVAGVITTVRQTPLSHLNLRAAQDGIPNAYVRNALQNPEIVALIDGFVRYEVTENGWSLRAATPKEVGDHYESSRPKRTQRPQRNLSIKSITPLSNVRFEDWTAFGVKAANVAELGRLGFPEGTVPDGFAIPFYFYDEFMKAHRFHERIEEMLADPDFQTDFDVQDDMLDNLRDDIRDADSPQWIIDALTEMHASFPEGTSLRYRSSTNNEDLPGFNGAGLYDSKTQDPEETVEDGIDKSLKGVFASLWTFRAVTEREFHRIDHSAAAMGVLVHPNFSNERANGVAVSFDPFYDLGGVDRYYVNTQVGEDLVTLPVANSLPEELLIFPNGDFIVLSTSSLLVPGQRLLGDDDILQLAHHLTEIHDHFETLYKPGPDEPFAMEIEFKITAENILAIKQARPWVFGPTPVTTTTTTTTNHHDHNHRRWCWRGRRWRRWDAADSGSLRCRLRLERDARHRVARPRERPAHRHLVGWRDDLGAGERRLRRRLVVRLRPPER